MALELHLTQNVSPKINEGMSFLARWGSRRAAAPLMRVGAAVGERRLKAVTPTTPKWCPQ